MRVKIVSDGTVTGTRITDAETGEPITGVTHLTVRIDHQSCHVELRGEDFELNAEAEAVRHGN